VNRCLTRTNAWRARLAAATAGRGRKAALARFLAGGDPARFNGQAVQIARVLNQGAGFEAEFLLACEEWMGANPSERTAAGASRGRSPGR
jgi:hypothetical protein